VTQIKTVYRLTNTTQGTVQYLQQCPNLRALGDDGYAVHKLELARGLGADHYWWTQAKQPNLIQFIARHVDRVDVVYAEIPAVRPEDLEIPPLDDERNPFQGVDLTGRELAERVA